MSHNEQKTTVLTIKDHINRQDMWAGKKKKIIQNVYILEEKTNKFVKRELFFSPALYKTIDEIIVNAIDYYIRYP